MKKFLFSLVLATAVLSVVQAQTVDEVLAKHMEAMGGKDKLASLSSVYLESVAVRPNGDEVITKTWKVHNQAMRREIDFGMGKIVSIVTDKEGWSSNPRSGGKFEAMPAEMVQAQQGELDCAGPLIDPAAKGHKAELMGREDVNGVSCHVVKLTTKSGREVTYFIDPNTYYVARMKMKGGMGMGMRSGAGAGGGNPNAQQAPPAQDREFVTDYSDYRKTPEGYVFPWTTTIVGMGASSNVEKLEVNKAADMSLFKPQ
jgi:outer membrane lipoprotein-sorting protein